MNLYNESSQVSYGKGWMGAPAELHELVERFDRNLDAYKSGDYNETQACGDFIDPLMELLGWDVHNRQGKAPAYRDVIEEDRVKVGGGTKAPDYGFYAGGERRFFLEAKKPSVDLAPAVQLRRYAWSAKLPLSILTDFEELAVYDCRYEPAKQDKPATARLDFITYDQYADRWDDLVELFSREAVLGGSLEKYAEANRKRRGTETVDAAFLREIEGWRSALARDLAARNNLNTRQLNYAVQLTIDRLIFLRMAEDRGIEEYAKLLGLVNGNDVYGRLVSLFRDADDRYNSGLFHFRDERDRGGEPDGLTPNLKIDDGVLEGIIRGLYYPESPYEFSVLPVDVLGQVYEQFLGSVIQLEDGNKATVEQKPEVRKAGGVCYTPTYIVDYIVQNTVGKLLEGKKPGPRGGASKLKVVDPACGSGSFLIGAYEYLLNWHRDRYLEDGPEKHQNRLYEGRGGNWHLTIDEKKRILLNNIYGVDIDPQAVEVTKLSLLIKVLEGESEQSLQTQLRMFQERALPDLRENVKCGNSLIGPDFYAQQDMALFEEEDHYRINVFDWQDNFPQVFDGEDSGFDAVIGNPPYDVLEKERGAASWPHSLLTEYVRLRPEYKQALGGKLNLFRFFVVRSLDLVREGGRFGMIVPLALLADKSTAQTRRHLMLSTKRIAADCFPQKDDPNRRIFHDAKLSTTIISSEKTNLVTEQTAQIQTRVYPGNSFDEPQRENAVKLTDAARLDPANLPIPLVDRTNWAVCKKAHSATRVVRLGEVEDVSVNRGEINQTIYREYITDDRNKARLLKGVEVGRYQLRTKLSQGQREWFDEQRFLASNRPKPIVEQRRIATQRITGVDERLRVVATVIEPRTYFADSTNSIVLKENSAYQLGYLVGLLNSALFQWRFKITSSNNNVGTNELDSMPFRTIDFSDAEDAVRYEKMVGLVGRMLELHEKLAEAKIERERTVIGHQVSATDKQIDNLVYELYGLTDEEIQIVEEATAR